MDTDVYEVLGDAGIDVYPSAGHTHRAEGGYPPKLARLYALRTCQQQIQRNHPEKLQQIAEVASEHEQPVLPNPQNCRTIPRRLRPRQNCVFTDDYERYYRKRWWQNQILKGNFQNVYF